MRMRRYGRGAPAYLRLELKQVWAPAMGDEKSHQPPLDGNCLAGFCHWISCKGEALQA